MTAKKQFNYRAFGEELSTEVALLQAASILDIAAKLAIEQREIERLETLAVLWMELGERMTGDEDEENGNGQGETWSIGFTGKGDYERVE